MTMLSAEEREAIAQRNRNEDCDWSRERERKMGLTPVSLDECDRIVAQRLEEAAKKWDAGGGGSLCV